VFRLERLVPGTYVLTAATAGRPPARSTPILVNSGAVTDNIKIVIAQGGVIEGNVFDEQHAPLADVELRFDLVSVVAQSDAVATTDASGHYRLEGAPPGLFTISTHKDGYRTKLVSGLSVSSGRTIAKDITLTKGNGLELAGIGATLAPSGNGIALAAVLSGDPADRVGLQVGDRIVRIDGEEIAGLSLVDAIQRLRGEPGAVVGLTVERGGETLDVTITRGMLMR
jgi:membrane-associated protease RseP (regulator of RpoE activity)